MSWWLAAPLAVLIVLGAVVVGVLVMSAVLLLGIAGLQALEKRRGEGAVDRFGMWFLSICGLLIFACFWWLTAAWLAS